MAATTEKKPAAKKVVAKKPALKKPAAAKKVAAKKTTATKISNKATVKISAEERYKMVETAAYFIAERNGFTGNSADYWIAAEAQIKKMLA